MRYGGSLGCSDVLTVAKWFPFSTKSYLCSVNKQMLDMKSVVIVSRTVIYSNGQTMLFSVVIHDFYENVQINITVITTSVSDYIESAISILINLSLH